MSLALLRADESATIRLTCLSGQNRLLVHLPRFRMIGSEERLSIGSGRDAVALVADTSGDGRGKGVSGAGEIPEDLETLVGSGLSASYGAQTSGPHPAPPQILSRAFVAACETGLPSKSKGEGGSQKAVNACLMQGTERLHVTPRRAVGTEPFWGARIEGRCVIYSHLDGQNGTRVWARYSKGPFDEVWSGALGERLFELRIRKVPSCSDGMSDKRYPFAVDLRVLGEMRKGCADTV